MNESNEAIEVLCPRCGMSLIVYLPQEEVPVCPQCKIRMVINEPPDGREL